MASVVDTIDSAVRAETTRRVAEVEWQAEVAIQNGCGLVCASDRSEAWASRAVPFGEMYIYDVLIQSRDELELLYPAL